MTQSTLPSPSSFNCDWTYDVFLNFRGVDTRHNFTTDLYDSLEQKGIRTFIDDKELKRGEEITPALLQNIKESRIFIAVFSKNYASSTYCLDELVLILECLKTPGRLFLPVFYGVDPSQVRHQIGTYAEAMAKHEKRFKDDKDKVQKWRNALRQAADVSGWHFQLGSQSEYKFIRKIVEEVSAKINRTPLHVAKVPVGLDSPVLEVTSLLELDSGDRINMVGICGIGGIGKSTVSRAVHNLIADQFEGVCFLADIRERASKHGLEQLQETLLNEILGEKDIKVGDVYGGISIIKRRLHRKKVLLILDDVDKQKQLQALAGDHDWFGYGSRIMITTRDKHFLANHGVVKLYEVKLLNDEKALELFSWHAFKTNKINPGYVDVSKRAVSYANGLPLAMEVIGSHLFGKSLDVWESALYKYKRILPQEIHKILRVSYDDLEEDEKGIFLDIACFFNSYEIGYVEDILYAHGFHVESGIQVLIDKSLIKIDGNGMVRMHDLIQDMGREIVRRESTLEPGKRSRLWFNEDIVHVLEENTGSNTIEVIVLVSWRDKEVIWNGKAFKKMKNLKILIISQYARFSQGPQNLPNSLRVLHWIGYPSPSLPSNFNPRKLMMLRLPEICLKSFKSLKVFESLICLDFVSCEFLTELPSLSGLPNLESLYLDGCSNLIRIHDSVGFLDRLVLLRAQECCQLQTFVPSINLTSLKTLDLRGCSHLKSFPEVLGVMENIREVYLDKTAIEELPLSIGNLVGLEWLFLRRCLIPIQLPSSIYMLPNLEIIMTYHCGGFRLSEDKEIVSLTAFPNSMCVYIEHGLIFLDVCSHNISPNNVIKVCSPSWIPSRYHFGRHLQGRVDWIKFRSKQPSVGFCFRKKFPAIGLLCVANLGMDGEKMAFDFKFSVLINGTKQFISLCNYIFHPKSLTEVHFFCDLQWKVEGVFSEHEWNQVEILCEMEYTMLSSYNRVTGTRDGATMGIIKEVCLYFYLDNNEGDFKFDLPLPRGQKCQEIERTKRVFRPTVLLPAFVDHLK